MLSFDFLLGFLVFLKCLLLFWLRFFICYRCFLGVSWVFLVFFACLRFLFLLCLFLFLFVFVLYFVLACSWPVLCSSYRQTETDRQAEAEAATETESERERERETNRQTDCHRQTDRQTDRHIERQRQIDRGRGRDRVRERDKQADRRTDRQTDRGCLVGFPWLSYASTRCFLNSPKGWDIFFRLITR